MAEIEPNAVYSPKQIAELASLSASFVKKHINQGKLKAHRLGDKVVRIKGKDAMEWLFGDDEEATPEDPKAADLQRKRPMMNERQLAYMIREKMRSDQN